MPTAYIHAADLQFPDRCIRCGGAASTTHEIDARRGIDLLFVAHWEFLEIPIPLCVRCNRHRRFSGIAMYTAAILFILVGGFASMALVMEEWKMSAGVLFALVLAVAIGLRVRGDSLLEWSTLGVNVDLLKGDDAPLRLRFRRDESFAAWKRVNPRAAFSQ